MTQVNVYLGNGTGAHIVSEARGYRAREEIIVASGSGKLPAGMILGRSTRGARSLGQAFVGTGNGVLTPDATTPVLSDAVDGAYTVTCITAAGNGGTFRVERPDGAVIGEVQVGQTFTDDVKFAIADGSTDFVVGDKFTLTVATAAGSGKYKPQAAAAQDGSESASAVLYETIDATSVDVKVTAHVRDCEVQRARLAFAGTPNDSQKSAAYAALAALGFAFR